jgi:hypothetical protein
MRSTQPVASNEAGDFDMFRLDCVIVLPDVNTWLFFYTCKIGFARDSLETVVTVIRSYYYAAECCGTRRKSIFAAVEQIWLLGN